MQNEDISELNRDMGTEISRELGSIFSPIGDEMRHLDHFLAAEFESREPFIHNMLGHISKFRGKQLRPALLFLIHRFVGGQPHADLIKIGAVLEMVHTATLVHDDLLDDAELRRQVETIHKRWGDRPAILMGDFIYSRAFHLSTEVPGMAQILASATHEICEGELLQIGHRYIPDLNEDVYFEIIRKKTAILHAVACQIGGMFANLDDADCKRLYQFGQDLGMAFQIIDDCLDYAGNEAIVGKSLGTDLHQGKVTLPLISLRERLSEEDREWLFSVLEGPLGPRDESRVQELVRDFNVVEDSLARAHGFVQRAKTVLSDMQGDGIDAAARESLELAAEYILRRQK